MGMATKASRQDDFNTEFAAMGYALRRKWEKHLAEKQRMAAQETELLRATFFTVGAATGARFVAGDAAVGAGKGIRREAGVA